MPLKRAMSQGMPSMGGRWSNAQLQQLWILNNGNPGAAPMAAAIALAESGGDPNATNNNSNGTVDRGLWQINSVHGAMSTYDTNGNARAAVSISSNGTDWSPWVTFQNGDYRQYLDGSSAARTGTTGGGSSKSTPDGSGSGGSTIADLSLSDLLTNPIRTLGDGLALVALGLVKTFANGVADYIIRPAWHFNLRAVAYFQQDILFSDSTQPWSTLTVTTFWSLGYAILFTDPNAPSLRPASVQNSRLARHTRRLQQVPARYRLTKPKHVEERTPTKPKAVLSAATVEQTGVMSTTRSTPVKVTGTHARTIRDSPNRSDIRIERAGTLPGANARKTTREAARGESDAKHRSGNGASSGGERNSHRATRPRAGAGR